MMSIQITVEGEAGPALARVNAFLAGEDLKNVVGYAAYNTVSKHLARINTERPNRLGGVRTNYYGGAAGRQSLSFSVNGDDVIISISKPGMRLHYHGGIVKPVRAKYLTIPATAEAHGRKASDFNLVVLSGSKGPYALALKEGEMIRTVQYKEREGKTPFAFLSRKKSDRGLRVMFWLRRKAEIEPDPTVIPDEATILDDVRENVAQVIDRKFKGIAAVIQKEGAA